MRAGRPAERHVEVVAVRADERDAPAQLVAAGRRQGRGQATLIQGAS